MPYGSYQPRECRTCGGRSSSNGMARASHQHSQRHIDALRVNLQTATDPRTQRLIESRIRTLELENAVRRQRRAELKAERKA